jgi:acetate kinase
MRVLVLNTGSSTLKWVVLDSDSEAVVQRGDASWDATAADDRAAALSHALEQVPRVDAVGHRVVHGGHRFHQPVLVDDAVVTALEELSELAPLHNPAALAGIEAARARFGEVPHVAEFDTAFHSTIADAAAVYPLPWEWTSRWKLRRYGFHGLSVEYACERALELLGHRQEKLVVCHLGAGCSVTAVADGRSVDTSMGFTPLEGLMMARRSGSVDPGLLLYLLQQHHMSAADLDRALNEDSGLLGVSGVSHDVRAVLAVAEAGSTRAALAVDMFVHRVVTSVGSMVATLGGIDVVVFTGGIGEHNAAIRERVCQRLAFLGLHLDLRRNATVTEDVDIGRADSQVRVLVITAREDLVILRAVKQVLAP